MIARRGFTLVEVMIALVIGGVVVTLAYATLRAGMDVEARVTEAREADVSMTTFRAMLSDALRHAAIGDSRDVPGLHTEVDGLGRISRLAFASRGITAPLGGSGSWQVRLSTDSTGVVLNATAIDSARAPLRLVARGSHAFTLRFLGADEVNWRTTWEDRTRLPSAVEVRFLDREGHDTMAALVARTAPVGGL